nr:hypothetical protein Iba_chr05aCG0930 [Ipomoea batatas]GMC94647.1 hypothetical protein Iba_chr05cCG1010 [Ipomoea batatas]GMC96665.1 hypothetical protein Iba_chr05dCG0090 [Ipomoea batatas]
MLIPRYWNKPSGTSISSQISLQKHYGMVVGFCVSCFLTVMQILTVIIANCLKVHTVAVPSVFLRRQEELGLIY